MNINNINKLYIHDKEFNCDDVISAAMIKLVNPNISIERVDQKINHINNALYLGVGGLYDYKLYKTRKDKHGNLYCLSIYSYDLCIDDLLKKENIHNISKARELFYQRYIKFIALITRLGYKFKKFKDCEIIESFNLNWVEDVYCISDYDTQFQKAVDFSLILIRNWIRQIKEDSDYRIIENEIWKKAEESEKNGIYVLDKHIPWQYQVQRHPNTKAKIIIFESNRGGYNVVSKSTEELEIKDSKYLRFLHPTHFMGVADSLSDAINAAKDTLLLSI